MAGVVIVVLGLLGVGGRILQWLPMPVAMGMLAGSVLGDVSHVVTATTQDVMVAGATVAGYAIGRLLQRPRIPPVGVAAIAGVLVVLLGQRATRRRSAGSCRLWWCHRFNFRRPRFSR
jgi:benzoate membrane transport protein